MNGNPTSDAPCWYASVQDNGRTALVLGPFETEAQCRQWAYYDTADGGNPAKHNRLTRVAECDPRSHWYSWGMVKLENGYKTGCLNSRIPEAASDMLERENARAKQCEPV